MARVFSSELVGSSGGRGARPCPRLALHFLGADRPRLHQSCRYRPLGFGNRPARRGKLGAGNQGSAEATGPSCDGDEPLRVRRDLRRLHLCRAAARIRSRHSRGRPNSFVIARNTAFTFKGKNLDAKAIGKELGVRYVLEGSVQRDANRVRVNAQLIDAESGAHVWADRFEDDVVDLFKLQDEVVARLARSLQVELVNAEAQRSLHDRPQNPDAIDLTMRGSALLNQSFTKANRHEALNLFEQALALDPTNADALAGAAFIDTTNYASGWFDENVDLYARAMQRANQALLINPNQADAHYAKARLIMFKAKPNDAATANQVISEAEAALRADPSFARAYWPMAVGDEFLGHYEKAISDLEQAIKISPRDSNLGVWQTEMGRALLGMGRTDAAVQDGLIGIDSGFRTVMSYTALAAFYAAADKMPEAKATMAEAMKLNPKLSVAWFDARTPSLINSPPGFREALIKAGLPEE
jgi:adenylate cyclase